MAYLLSMEMEMGRMKCEAKTRNISFVSFFLLGTVDLRLSVTQLSAISIIRLQPLIDSKVKFVLCQHDAKIKK